MADANDFGSHLAEINEQFKNTKAQSECSIEDGIYQFILKSAELTSTPDKNDPKIKIPTILMKFECLAPQYEKQVVTTWDRLNKSESIGFFKEKALRLGLDPKTLDLMTIEVDLKKIVGSICTCAISNKAAPQGNRTFTNLFVRSLDAPPQR